MDITQHFVNNDAFKAYRTLIEQAQTRQRPAGRTHKHHILPRSIYGPDAPGNYVVLTIDEHIEAHRLLALCTTGEARTKMVTAFDMMKSNREYFLGDKSPCQRPPDWTLTRTPALK